MVISTISNQISLGHFGKREESGKITSQLFKHPHIQFFFFKSSSLNALSHLGTGRCVSTPTLTLADLFPSPVSVLWRLAHSISV